MKRNEDPKEMFENIANIKARYVKPGSKIPPEDELVAVVMSAAPREYQSLLISKQSRIGSAVTMDDLESAMTKIFRANSHMRNSKEGKELALTGMTCFSCKRVTSPISELVSSFVPKWDFQGQEPNSREQSTCFYIQLFLVVDGALRQRAYFQCHPECPPTRQCKFWVPLGSFLACLPSSKSAPLAPLQLARPTLE